MVPFVLKAMRYALVSFANSADYPEAIDGSKLVALPGAGHLPQQEVPGSVEVLREFLKQSKASRAVGIH